MLSFQKIQMPSNILQIDSSIVHLFTAIAFVSLVFFLLLDLSMTAQLWLSICLLAMAITLWSYKGNECIRVMLFVLSATASFRYIYWRSVHTLNFSSLNNGIFSLLLLSAELYVVAILFLNYFQILYLDRSYDNITPDPGFTPSVDIFIATYNEPYDILRRTVCGAQGIKYLNKRVYLLDDGRRQEAKRLADELGCSYVTRKSNEHAKAGNINHALTKTSGEYVLILDADHIPMPDIIERTISLFKDPKLALVQTPHRFLNPAPTERNLYLEDRLPQEQELFYQRVQVGNNHWNAAFFCGSAAILKRSALMAVGGIATNTITEDCHTSLKMHALGYKSAYVSTPLSVGLSPESFDGYIIQRTRWARGMIQILRLDNPLVKPGLTIPQRLCYFSSMIHFFFGVPRLIFFLAPMAFLLLHICSFQAMPVDMLVMVAPHLMIATLANNYQYGNIRHSFWSEIYETTLAPYMAYITTLAFINPGLAKFNVTPKGKAIERVHFNPAGFPISVCLILCLGTLLVGPMRWMANNDVTERQAIALNTFWAFFNFLLTATAVWVAIERPIPKRAHRIKYQFPVNITTGSDKKVVSGTTQDINEFGVLIKLTDPMAASNVSRGTKVIVSFVQPSKLALPLKVEAIIRRVKIATNGANNMIALEFINVSPDKDASLKQLIYSNQKIWSWFREPKDSLIRSYWDLIASPFRAACRTGQTLIFDQRKESQ